MNLSLKMPET